MTCHHGLMPTFLFALILVEVTCGFLFWGEEEGVPWESYLGWERHLEEDEAQETQDDAETCIEDLLEVLVNGHDDFKRAILEEAAPGSEVTEAPILVTDVEETTKKKTKHEMMLESGGASIATTGGVSVFPDDVLFDTVDSTRVSNFISRSGLEVSMHRGRLEVQSEDEEEETERGRKFRSLVWMFPEAADALFWHVDRISTRKRLSKSLKEDGFSVDATEDADDAPLECRNTLSNKGEKCVRRAIKAFNQDSKDVLNAAEVTIANTTENIRQLDLMRFQAFARAGAACARKDDDLDQMNECLRRESPSLQEEYAISYQSNKTVIQNAIANRDFDLRLLRNKRDSTISDFCCPETAERRSLQKRFSGVGGGAHMGNERDNGQKRKKSSRKPVHGRSLEDEEETSSLVCNVQRFDEMRQAELENFPDDLFRSLAGDAAATEAPDFFTIEDFSSDDVMEQKITNKNKAFSLEVKRVANVEVDIKALLRGASAPKKVRKFAQRTGFEATPIEATETNTNVDFVGLIFSQDKGKQLLWPVDFSLASGGENEELTRRTRSLALRPRSRANRSNSRRHRRLEESNGEIECVEPDVLDDDCVVEAELNFDEAVARATADRDEVAAAVRKGIAAQDEVRVNEYSTAGTECASRDENFEPNPVFTCLREEKSPRIVEAYLTEVQKLENLLFVAEAVFDREIDRLERRLKRQQDRCCLSFSAAPTASAVPTMSAAPATSLVPTSSLAPSEISMAPTAGSDRPTTISLIPTSISFVPTVTLAPTISTSPSTETSAPTTATSAAPTSDTATLAPTSSSTTAPTIDRSETGSQGGPTVDTSSCSPSSINFGSPPEGSISEPFVVEESSSMSYSATYSSENAGASTALFRLSPDSEAFSSNFEVEDGANLPTNFLVIGTAGDDFEALPGSVTLSFSEAVRFDSLSLLVAGNSVTTVQLLESDEQVFVNTTESSNGDAVFVMQQFDFIATLANTLVVDFAVSKGAINALQLLLNC